MINEQIFRNVLNEIKENPKVTNDIIDSFSDNQFLSKRTLIKFVNDLNILNEKTTVAIRGSWYGSILIP